MELVVVVHGMFNYCDFSSSSSFTKSINYRPPLQQIHSCRRLSTDLAASIIPSCSMMRKRRTKSISSFTSTSTCSSFSETHSNGVSTATLTDTSSFKLKKMAFQLLDGLKGTSLFIVGMNCTMKTDVAKQLAEELGYYFLDSDSLVKEVMGSGSASSIEEDAKGYRESETEVLKQLTSMGRLVVCAGDGAVQGYENLGLLRHGISVWVDIPIDLIVEEITKTGNRYPSAWEVSPSDSYNEVLTKLSKFYEEMKDGYATADAKVSLQRVATMLDYDKLHSVTSVDMALEALREIEKLTRVKKMMEEAARPF